MTSRRSGPGVQPESDRPDFWRSAAVLIASVVAVTAACTPVFNWRDAGVGDSGLVVLLPCKPDRATRDVVLGDDDVALRMAGCEAGGATFTIAYAVARDATQATAWMSAWRTTMASKLETQAPVETPVDVRGAATSPAAIQLLAEGSDASGSKTPAKIWWFAQTAATGQVMVYQAMVLGQPSEAEASTTFFESLRLP